MVKFLTISKFKNISKDNFEKKFKKKKTKRRRTILGKKKREKNM
jgi:hypothetical protein